MPLDEKDWDRMELHLNLEKFTEKLGYRNAPHHSQLYRRLRDRRVKRLLVICPPRHGKSTCATINYPLWEVGKNPNLRFIVASYAKDFVSTFMREIMARMQSPEYVEIFGDLKPEKPNKWTQNELIVSRSMISKDSTFTALSVGQGIIGRGADIIIADDIIDEDSAQSEVERRNVRNWFNKELLSRLEPNGRLIVIGTRWHFADIYSDLIKETDEQNKSLYEKLIYPAIDENNQALWSDKWPLETLLARKKEIGEIAFSAQYLCDPTPQEGAIFKLDWLHYWHETNEDHAHRIYKRPPIEKLVRYQGWDLAISENPEADYTVCVTVGVDIENRIYLLDIQRGHWDFPTQVRMVEAQASAWRPVKIAIESNAYQKALPQQLRHGLIPVVEVKQDTNKTRRISSLSPYFENGTILVSKDQDDFLMEYLQFPRGAHEDILDAFHLTVTNFITVGLPSKPEDFYAG